MIEILLAPLPTTDIDALLDAVTSAPAAAPFDERRVAFVVALSRAILLNRRFREFPELMAAAHWFREVNLRELRATLGTAGVFVRRGVVFHIAPSNVDSVFVYSWLLSFLCGNASVVRVSRRRTPQMQAFYAVVAELLASDEFRAIASANLVVSYDHDAALTARLSERCHLRVVWGGDATIATIRAVPLPALATELAFANRFSLAALSARAVLDLDAPGLATLAQGFYVDAFWFNQQACSSPRALVWIGTPDDVAAARERFWPALSGEIAARGTENVAGQVMDRATTLFRLAHARRVAAAQTAIGALPTRLRVDVLDADDRANHDGNGIFLELERPALADVAPLLTSRDQTIAHFGVHRDEWLALLPALPPHAADRIVPVGQALAFGAIWDGVDLLRAFTRQIDLR